MTIIAIKEQEKTIQRKPKNYSQFFFFCFFFVGDKWKRNINTFWVVQFKLFKFTFAKQRAERVRKGMRVQSSVSVVCVAVDQRQWEDTNNALLALFFPDGKPIPPIMDRAMLKSSDI